MAGHVRAVGGAKPRVEGEAPVSSATPAPASSVVDAPALALRPRIETFGKYRLVAEMGHGGMADVFLAVTVGPAGFSKMQVIKRLRSSLAEDPELQAMLLDEARLAAQLNHRNIVQTLEVGAVDECYFIAMELLEGQPWSRISRRCKAKGAPLPLPLVVRVLSEVLAGLHYAHEAKDYEGRPLSVVHRDVSPQNVFVTYDGQVKVMDFGIAKAARRIVETQTGTVRGKVAYMAPEQSQAKTDDLDHRADVFSVGVMLWEELVGARMWAGKADPEILLTLSSRGVPPLPDRPDIPAELARICARATALHRDDRYENAARMRADLEAYLLACGEPAALETLGERVAALFTEDRARMQKIVERQLASLRASDLADDPSSWASSGARAAAGASARRERANHPGAASRDTVDEKGTAPMEPGDSTRPDDPSRAASRARAAASSGRSRSWVIAAAAVLVVTGALVVRDRLSLQSPGDVAALPGDSAARTDTPAPSSSPAPPLSAEAAPSSSASAAATSLIRVRIAATPPSARISIDGIAVATNPFEGTLVKDVAMHRIMIEAPGFQTHGRMVAFDRDLDLDIPLRVRPRGPGTGTAPENPSLPPLKPR